MGTPVLKREAETESQAKQFVAVLMKDSVLLGQFLNETDVTKMVMELGFCLSEADLQELKKVKENIGDMVNRQISRVSEDLTISYTYLCNGVGW